MSQTLTDEPARLSALDRYAVLDTPAEAQFDRITTLVRTVLKVPVSAVSLIDGHRQWFKSRQGLDVDATERRISFCNHTIRTRAPMVVPDATQDSRFAENPLVTGPPYIRSYAGAPLATPEGYNVGALCAIDMVPRSFDAAQIDILSSFAALVVNELELRMIAQTDFLTGAFSRRGLTFEAEQALTRHARTNEPASLVALDVDRFKAVNDTMGHAVGDAVLASLVEACSQVTRTHDMVGRMGGEEFAVLLPGASGPDALASAERMRTAIEAMVVPGHPALRVTASFGIAALHNDTGDVAAWMARADHALYAAKAGGRNRCCVA